MRLPAGQVGLLSDSLLSALVSAGGINIQYYNLIKQDPTFLLNSSILNLVSVYAFHHRLERVAVGWKVDKTGAEDLKGMVRALVAGSDAAPARQLN